MPQELFFCILARSVAHVQAAIEHIYPLVYEFKKPRTPKEVSKEEEELLNPMIDSDDDEDIDFDPQVEDDPLELEPPKKKQKFRDVSHLAKRFKGRSSKRPPGKASNDPSEDNIYVSDGDFDADDPDDF